MRVERERARESKGGRAEGGGMSVRQNTQNARFDARTGDTAPPLSRESGDDKMHAHTKNPECTKTTDDRQWRGYRLRDDDDDDDDAAGMESTLTFFALGMFTILIGYTGGV